MNTHRTMPDNQKDPLVLKNLIKEAEKRLLEKMSKRETQPWLSRLSELEAKLDHRRNLESLILFVNKDMAEFLRLPFAVVDRVVIDQTFATRDIVRSLHLDQGYFVLVLSQRKVRLIEAYNERVVAEISNPFPMVNDQPFSTSREEASDSARQTQLVAEYFNRVDKEVNKVRKDNPLPVLICTEGSHYAEFLKVADQKSSILNPYLSGNRMEEKANGIVSEAWKIVREINSQRNNARIGELKEAVSRGLFLSDVNDIWRGVSQGRIKTLFVEQGLFQPAWVEGDSLDLITPGEQIPIGAVDDIFDEMIEMNRKNGGDEVFLAQGELKDFNGIGATMRY